MSFMSSLTHYMTTGTSIIGAAVATPAVAAVITGQMTLKQAALPLLGSAIAIAMPQKSAPPAAGVPVVAPVAPPNPYVAVKNLLDELAALAAASNTKTGTAIAAAVPEVEKMAEAGVGLYGIAGSALAQQAAVPVALPASASQAAAYVPVGPLVTSSSVPVS